MLTKGAHHYSLCVADVEVSRSFYGDLLGLPEIERPDFGIPGIWYQAGTVQLHLIQVPEEVEAGSLSARVSPTDRHIAFEIDDYEAVLGRLTQAGLEVTGLGAKVGQMFVHDPDKNMIEFIAPGGQLGRR